MQSPRVFAVALAPPLGHPFPLRCRRRRSLGTAPPASVLYAQPPLQQTHGELRELLFRKVDAWLGNSANPQAGTANQAAATLTVPLYMRVGVNGGIQPGQLDAAQYGTNIVWTVRLAPTTVAAQLHVPFALTHSAHSPSGRALLETGPTADPNPTRVILNALRASADLGGTPLWMTTRVQMHHPGISLTDAYPHFEPPAPTRHGGHHGFQQAQFEECWIQGPGFERFVLRRMVQRCAHSEAGQWGIPELCPVLVPPSSSVRIPALCAAHAHTRFRSLQASKKRQSKGGAPNH
ncbi:hypothetical protein MKEN_00284200 [Mycena kentingensis (nom. inval.)]|nr:hypothetical protein MKEN_00284200 [Mycena kentingensis (nom. inval.)]